MGAELEVFHDFQDDLIEEIGGAVIIDPVQSPNENIVVQVFRGYSGPE